MTNNKNNPDPEKPINENNDPNIQNTPGLEEQEQQNTQNLQQRIEEENQPDPNYGDVNETIDEPSQGEEDLSGFTERTLSEAESPLPENDAPITDTALGDTPSASETAAFEAGPKGDLNADDAKCIADNIRENFRENIDKTKENIELDKQLKSKPEQ